MYVCVQSGNTSDDGWAERPRLDDALSEGRGSRRAKQGMGGAIVGFIIHNSIVVN